jgi:hypothetical protein
VALDHGKSEDPKYEIWNTHLLRERASTSKFSRRIFEEALVTLMKTYWQI